MRVRLNPNAMRYAHVVVCKKIGEFDRPLTYEVPEELARCLKEGQGVKICFRSRAVQGIVVGFCNGLPPDLDEKKIKFLGGMVEHFSLTPFQIQLAQWMAEYYQSSWGRILRLMVPKLLWEGRDKGSHSWAETPVLSPPLLPAPDPRVTAFLKSIPASLQPVLFYGAGSSFKTQVYLELLAGALKNGRQALLLVPEIILTPPALRALKNVFGERVAVWHSQLTEKERVCLWKGVAQGKISLMVGSRSALFMPWSSLGIVILDEEHDPAYKQESAPYYDAHAVAEELTKLHGARLILASASPRLESYSKALRGEILPLPLPQDTELPSISVVDLRDEFKKKNFSPLSLRLQQAVALRLAKKEQVILFINRRGAARAMICRDCGHMERCPLCEIPLKCHGPSLRSGERLLCHACSFQKIPPSVCASCQSPFIHSVGVGTEKVEAEVRRLFPQARLARADRDTLKKTRDFTPLYEAFLRHEYDLLIGTQILAKGLRFPRVTLMGIILADQGLGLPDFRSHERTYQLLSQLTNQVSEGPGQVILQTYQPDHFVIQALAQKNYSAFADQELQYRQKWGYPPWGQLLKLTATGQVLPALQEAIQSEVKKMEAVTFEHGLSLRLQVTPAFIPKIGGRFSYHVLIRGNKPQELFRHWTLPHGWRANVDPLDTF